MMQLHQNRVTTEAQMAKRTQHGARMLVQPRILRLRRNCLRSVLRILYWYGNIECKHLVSILGLKIGSKLVQNWF